MLIPRRRLLQFLPLSLISPRVGAASDLRPRWQPAPEGTVHRIAFGSCAFQWEPQPIWKTIGESQSELFLFLGDNIYGDWHGDAPFTPSAESLAADYQKLAAKAEFAAVREKVHMMATWDNHDYGLHNGGAEFALKEMARKVFLDFFGEPLDSPRRKRDGIYDAKVIGPEGKRVQVIMLDNRWNRGPLIPDTRSDEERTALGIVGSMGHTPNVDITVTMLGESQWQWLEEQLKQPAEIRLICSGTQIINDSKGMQEWGNFPHERKRLFDLIAQSRTNGVLLLSGNVHYSEVSKTDEGPYSIYDFTSSGMTHNSQDYAQVESPYRVAGAYAQPSFGLIKIDWEAAPSPLISLQAIGLDGDIVFEHQLSLDGLQI
jgi:alkaline phosphatase D